MDIGAIFIGLAAVALLVFYITEPFRKKAQDVNVMIDQWVTSVSDASALAIDDKVTPDTHSPAVMVAPDAITPAATTAKFCHHCGNPIKPGHRFCPKCGTKLAE